jgi:multimeric flavodoxin WrbA
MTKNILIVSASPRPHGNSAMLCDEFARGARDARHTVRILRLRQQHINSCTGCCTCIHKPGECVQQDDMNDIMNMVLDADVIVFASPVYFRSFNGQMKTFMDRLCPVYTMIRNKDVYFLVAAAGGSLPVDSAFDSFRVFTDCLHGSQEKGAIAVTGVWEAGGAAGSRALEEAYAAGLNV